MKINKKIIRLKRFVNSNVIASEARQSRRMTRLKAGKPISLLLALTIILSLFLVAVPMAGIAEVTYYYVREDGDDSHNGLVDDADHAWLTIQYAINTVSSGNTINVAAGEYDEGSLVFNKNDITLIGSGADKTTIITSSSIYGVSVPSGVDDIKIRDLTIKEDTTYDADTCSGPGSERFHLKISHNSRFTLKDVNLEGPGKDYSCIVGLDLNSVQDVIVRDVHISGYSTNGVGVIASSNLLFLDITIEGNGYNGSTGWAGISFYTVDSEDITNVQFAGTNSISNNPMGIYVENIDGDVHITGTGTTTLSGNRVSPLVTTKVRNLSIVDAYAKDVFNVPVRLENAFATLPNSVIVGYWHDVTSAGEAANNPSADGNPVIFNLTNGEWYVVEGMNIQAAIDVASDGNTINVAPGTYHENILIDKALTVKSTGGAMGTIIHGSTLYMITINHSDVIFEGFTVTKPDFSGTDTSGILIQSAGAISNVQILDNIITQMGIPALSGYGAAGINIGSGPLSDIVISGNTITDIKTLGDVGSSPSDHTCGINIWDGASNVVISYNTISDIKYNGIILEGASNVQIYENDITSCESGIRVNPRVQEINNIQISDNDITGCKYGISVVRLGLPSFLLSDLTVNYNNLFGNTEYGVFNTTVYEIDATNNWWGHASGPSGVGLGSGDAVSDNVKFIPFLAISGGDVVDNVSITKSGPTSANSGDDITYKIIYKNIGTNYATNVVITETYPSEVEYRSATPAPDSGTNNRWTIPTLAPGEGDTIKVTVHIK